MILLKTLNIVEIAFKELLYKISQFLNSYISIAYNLQLLYMYKYIIDTIKMQYRAFMSVFIISIKSITYKEYFPYQNTCQVYT